MTEGGLALSISFTRLPWRGVGETPDAPDRGWEAGGRRPGQTPLATRKRGEAVLGLMAMDLSAQQSTLLTRLIRDTGLPEKIAAIQPIRPGGGPDRGATNAMLPAAVRFAAQARKGRGRTFSFSQIRGSRSDEAGRAIGGKRPPETWVSRQIFWQPGSHRRPAIALCPASAMSIAN